MRFGVRASVALALLGTLLSLVVPASPAAAATDVTWTTSVAQLDGGTGLQSARCPELGFESFRNVWGTNTYDDSSSICTAAVHAGVLNPDTGGVVTFQPVPRLEQYVGTTRNGVTTISSSSRSGPGFVFVNSTTEIGSISWVRTATEFGSGARAFSFRCPELGFESFRNVWGTNTYDDSSSICTAAVHAGVLNPDTGGVVTFQPVPRLEQYVGTTRNGVTTISSSSRSGPGFVFVNSTTEIGSISWVRTATEFGSGARAFSFRCPELGFESFRNVWGTNTYDDSSSICTAAVHAGVLNPDTGGVVTFQPVPRLEQYVGTTRNGVTTISSSSRSGPGFVFVNSTTEIGSISWNREADEFGSQARTFSFRCPPIGASSFDTVWGTDTYDDDSGICTAAVHAGELNANAGGTVTLDVVPGIGAYTGSTRNGVTTLSGNRSGPAFEFNGKSARQTTVTEIQQWSRRQTTVSEIDIPAPRRSGLDEVTSVVPARLLDTRSVGRTVDGRFEAVALRRAGSTIELDVLGRGGVALDASTVIVNVTAVRPAGAGFLTIYPCGEPRPNASNVNYVSGDVVANLVLAKVGVDGKICVYTSARSDILVDVNGFVPSGETPESVVPARLLDTRSSGQTVDGRFQRGGVRGAGSTLQLEVLGRGGVGGGASAVLINVTAVRPTGPGFVTVFPCGEPRPNASNVNYGPGDVVANLVLAKVGSNGRVCVYTSAQSHVIADVNGFVPSGETPESVVPARLLDTRSSGQTVDGRFQRGGVRGAGSTLQLEVLGRGGVGGGASAVLINVTAVRPTGPGFVTVFPCGEPRPNASNVNYGPGDVVANLVLAKVGSNGRVCVYTSAQSHVLVDVNGTS